MERFLRNRNTSAALGPFDGVVAAVCAFENTEYLISTHTDYVPALPTSREHDLFLRSDLRYGPDDFTRWPQQYSTQFCHLPCVRTKAGSPPELSILWWDPDSYSFVMPTEDYTLTPGLGKLDAEHRTALTKVVHWLRGGHSSYVARAGTLPALGALVVAMDAALDRLDVIPLTFDEMVLSVTHLQMTCLELDAMLQYMTVYKPRIQNPYAEVPELAKAIGALTADAKVAQMLHKAGLPYWYLRPAKRFAEENILQMVEAVSPMAVVQVDAHPREKALRRTSNRTEDKIAAIHAHSLIKAWYEDPYDLTVFPTSAGGQSCRDGQQSRSSGGREQSRSESAQSGRLNPYARPSPATKQVKQAAGRDKFSALDDRPEMPSTIISWQCGLAQVNRSLAPTRQRDSRDTYYIFPEPALLASPSDVATRHQRLFHFELMRDALAYRLGNWDGPREELLLSSQEWRDVLSGKVAARNDRKTKTQQRIGVIEHLLQPALRACGLDRHCDLPVPPAKVPPITLHRAREIIWSVAEMSFRFELLSLDRRASGINRPEVCLECFPSPRLLDIPLEEGKRGFAAMTLQERHLYTVRLGRLMRDWRDPPVQIRELVEQSEWSEQEQWTLAQLVPTFYCQQFYENFGRAAVVPLRIEHEFGL